jgi:hypothetical protein
MRRPGFWPVNADPTAGEVPTAGRSDLPANGSHGEGSHGSGDDHGEGRQGG